MSSCLHDGLPVPQIGQDAQVSEREPGKAIHGVEVCFVGVLRAAAEFVETLAEEFGLLVCDLRCRGKRRGLQDADVADGEDVVNCCFVGGGGCTRDRRGGLGFGG